MIKLFKHFNTDGDGTLSLDEFKKMMLEMQIGLSDERIMELFDSIDMDKSGGIDIKEFIHGLFPTAYAQFYGHKKHNKSKRRSAHRHHGGQGQAKPARMLTSDTLEDDP